MNFQKVSFINAEGHSLAGRLELPAHRAPHNFAVFAHCFTCTKNLSAVKNISRGLTAEGFGVLRFDFTGLGESEGDFEDTNFSGNVDDLLAAATYLSKEYEAPTLLVGHSLGGAAVLVAASKLSSVQAVATIGAPSTPKHVKHLLKDELQQIKAQGLAEVQLSGRSFTIKQQFLEDLERESLQEIVSDLRKTALLVMHSPQDTLVGVHNAEELYLAAHHPKSFVSLDGADHLLTNVEDSTYTGLVIAKWASRYVPWPEEKKIKTAHQVVASLDKEDGFTTQMRLGDHFITADEPTDIGGNNFGPTPYELLSASLSACTAMTLQMYAKRKEWNLEHVEVHTSYDKRHAEDCENCTNDSAKIDTFVRAIKLTGNLSEKEEKRLLQIADKCPVHKTLHSSTQVITKLIS
ncbi:bifunctional alpha/beta hydrolase/OsmC family protein [Altibacter sp. HG106]|uniref:bifunctional alpha/beta hydrolase/OsmC family protein n=1 Tax=Altibacter sp. HG106 TaxID=3023937 RepID=UPI0023503248|nr:bifunctional alpha/beta hydrolase/OsmC family protein [Altibacter sp. HG106]MDC7993809.1 bifunctional alpha/beta hydrolase/OsmC family protein [Altibacter sp. HG106]